MVCRHQGENVLILYVEEAPLDPVLVIPWVECDDDLLEDVSETPYRHVNLVEGVLRMNLIGVLHPTPTELPLRDGDGHDAHRLIETAEQNLLPRDVVDDFERRYLEVPFAVDVELMCCPL